MMTRIRRDTLNNLDIASNRQLPKAHLGNNVTSKYL